jgi:hypothetical protein
VAETERAKARSKSKIWAKVEHAIGVIKRVFGFYRGLDKIAHACSSSARSPILPTRSRFPPPSMAPFHDHPFQELGDQEADVGIALPYRGAVDVERVHHPSEFLCQR